MELIKTFGLDDTLIDVGSDWHLDASDPTLPGRVVDHVRDARGSATLFCLGDLFDTRDGEDTSERVNETIAGFADCYDQVIFVAGNHDLRGRDRPWSSFDLPDNVISPRGDAPVIAVVGSKRVLVADLFYDLAFIDPAVIDSYEDRLLGFYATTPDGRFLLGGDTSRFAAMTERAAAALTPDIDLLVTHSLPHPSLVTFRIAEETDETRRLTRELGIPFLCDPEDDERTAAEYRARGRDRATAEGVRTFWNHKSLVMGSDVLGHPRADFRDGLTIVHGRHHRNDLADRLVAGKRVHVVTHQPCPWKPSSGIAL